jgi:hypothetical protein
MNFGNITGIESRAELILNNAKTEKMFGVSKKENKSFSSSSSPNNECFECIPFFIVVFSKV